MYAPTSTRSGAARADAATANRRNARSGWRTTKGRRAADLWEGWPTTGGIADRSGDWMAQAEQDLGLARTAAREAFHEWACFAAQQAAEKALKAANYSHLRESRTHLLT